MGDDWQFGGSFSKIVGRHTIKAGADFETNNFTSPIAYSNIGFDVEQTSSLGASSTGGISWASLLLGVPNSAGYRNIFEDVRSGWIDGIYIEDQFKATPKLTINMGFRNDMVCTPIYGTHNGGDGNYYTGNANPVTGQYELNALPPTARPTRARLAFRTGSYTASSTPGTGRLPANAYVSPISPRGQELAGRLGAAARLGLTA